MTQIVTTASTFILAGFHNIRRQGFALAPKPLGSPRARLAKAEEGVGVGVIHVDRGVGVASGGLWRRGLAGLAFVHQLVRKDGKL